MKLGFLDMSAAAPHDGVEYILTMKYVILYSSTVEKYIRVSSEAESPKVRFLENGSF